MCSRLQRSVCDEHFYPKTCPLPSLISLGGLLKGEDMSREIYLICFSGSSFVSVSGRSRWCVFSQWLRNVNPVVCTCMSLPNLLTSGRKKKWTVIIVITQSFMPWFLPLSSRKINCQHTSKHSLYSCIEQDPLLVRCVKSITFYFLIIISPICPFSLSWASPQEAMRGRLWWVGLTTER